MRCGAGGSRPDRTSVRPWSINRTRAPSTTARASPHPTVITGPMSAFEEYLTDWRFGEDWRPVVERLGSMPLSLL